MKRIMTFTILFVILFLVGCTNQILKKPTFIDPLKNRDEIVEKCFVPKDGPCYRKAIGCCVAKNHGIMYNWQTNSCKETALREHKPPFNSIAECESLCLNIKTKDFGKGYIDIENKIYLNQQPLEGANPETFEVIYSSELHKTMENRAVHYSKDKNNVFFRNDRIENADSKSFEIISPDSNRFYSKDKRNVYYKTSIVQNADLETFILLMHPYAADKNYVYKYENIVEGKNPETFRP